MLSNLTNYLIPGLLLVGLGISVYIYVKSNGFDFKRDWKKLLALAAGVLAIISFFNPKLRAHWGRERAKKLRESHEGQRKAIDLTMKKLEEERKEKEAGINKAQGRAEIHDKNSADSEEKANDARSRADEARKMADGALASIRTSDISDEDVEDEDTEDMNVVF